jgi:signal transduction histidine kinase
MYLNAILAAIGMLTLFEPLRDKVGDYIHRAFRERVDLERAVTRARASLLHVVRLDEMPEVVIAALEQSRRATGAALYLRDPMGFDFELADSFGPPPPKRLEWIAMRPLVERLASTSVVLESVAAEAMEHRQAGRAREAEADERLLAAGETLGAFKGGACFGIRSESSELLGMLVLVDDRISDAFSVDDVALVEALALQIGVVIENSRQYRKLQERDRLAALGQMAAGLAHEVKNPLGAIKGAAQLLVDPADGHEVDASSREFLGIILEEVDRLDRVVRSVLDYGRPSLGNPGSVDVNAAVRRTLQVLGPSRDPAIQRRLDTAEDVPAVRVDEEQLRQVLINLVSNAEEAMAGAGEVTVTTRHRASPTGAGYVEIGVHDRGPGIPPEAMEHLFVPFFTTKPRGTGLGLAISQRMIQAMGGRIEVSAQPGVGSAFVILLPAYEGGSPRNPSAGREHAAQASGQATSGREAPSPRREGSSLTDS